MPEAEYITNSSFYFDIDGIELVIKSVSGISIEMKVAGGGTAIGCMKGGKAQTQAVPGGVTYGSAVTLKFVAGNEGSQQAITDWYQKCHPQSYTGGAKEGRSNRKTGSFVIYDGNGNEGARYTFFDLFPNNLTQTKSVGVDKMGELAEDSIELQFTKLVREV